MTRICDDVEVAVDEILARVGPVIAQPCLKRLKLDAPAGFQSRIAQRLLVLELRARGR